MNASSVQQMNKGPKACTTCAKAKARCIPGPDGSLKCDRCLRLNKPCLSQTPAPPRARKSPKLSKIAALEKRLEELSSHVQDGPSQSSSPPPKKETEVKCPVESLISGSKWDFYHLFPLRPSIAADEDVSHMPSPPSEGPRPWDSWWPTPQEGEMLLAVYRDVHAELLPFVHVPPDTTSLDLRQHHPFVWKAIMMVGCFLDAPRQVKLGKELLTEIAQAAIVDGGRNLDLLQGLQMLLAWFHYALKGSQVTNLLFLARAMCVNLAFKDDPALEGEERDKNLDHMRAFACTYYLNTLVFTANKRHDVLMDTELLETCCKVLESTVQYPTDILLVKLVRIQQLAQSISLTMATDNITKQAMKLPLRMVVQSFQDQLDLFSSSLPPHLVDNDTLKGHVHIAQVLLYEIAISDQHTDASYVPLTDRLNMLWACVRALRSYYDVRFSHREIDRPRFTCLCASDFAYSVLAGVRLLTLQLPGWNLTQIRQELNLVEAMDTQVQDLDIILARRRAGLFPGVAAYAREPPPEDPFERLMRQLKAVREMVKQEIARQAAGAATMPSSMDFAQDMFIGDFDSDVWESIGSTQVWNVIGDPSVLDSSMEP